MISVEHILGKFSRAGCRQRSHKGEPSLVTKTRVPLESAWVMHLGNALCGEGGGDR